MKGMAKRGFRCWKQKSDIAFWQKYAPKTYIPHLRINILPPESFFPLPTGKGEVIWRGEVGVSDTWLCSKSSSQKDSKFEMGTGEDRVRFSIESCTLQVKVIWNYSQLTPLSWSSMCVRPCFEQASWPRVKTLPLSDFDPKDLIWNSKSRTWQSQSVCEWASAVRDAAQKKTGFFGNFSQRGGGGLLKSQNFCKFTKCFFVCQNHS